MLVLRVAFRLSKSARSRSALENIGGELAGRHARLLVARVVGETAIHQQQEPRVIPAIVWALWRAGTQAVARLAAVGAARWLTSTETDM